VQVKFHLSDTELSPKDCVHKPGKWEADEGFGLASVHLSSRWFSRYRDHPGLSLIVLVILKFTWQ